MQCKQRAEDDIDTVNKPKGHDRSSGRRGGARDGLVECDDDGESDDGTNPMNVYIVNGYISYHIYYDRLP